ncbi:hypothetical protein B0A67_24280 [Flavobacterium aquidurense]|uniref:hypothetical protein n=1 Tax=Flavobacterium aquidurense TaxID=362413 RepID=UPI00091D5728|nr:hypothetical protein [Flavobacterium aquidurense]OXA65575.1 hypothetical protein B0A67_24280 [Flavobacterium aquidurense]SHH90075.1 hypothetical protein SAMN05444481_1446 [Flavobacterium frigidimaris]
MKNEKQKSTNLISYKCRAELASDAYHFALDNSLSICFFKVEPIQKGIPDVVVTFESSLSIEELKLRLSKINDAHVMSESLKIEEEYDGERMSFEEETRKESTKEVQLDFLEKFIETIEKGDYTLEDEKNFRHGFWLHFPDEYIDLFRVFSRMAMSTEEYLPKAKKYLELLKLYSYEETMKKIYKK